LIPTISTTVLMIYIYIAIANSHYLKFFLSYYTIRFLFELKWPNSFVNHWIGIQLQVISM